MRRVLLACGAVLLGVIPAACSGDYDRYPDAASPPPAGSPSTTAAPTTTAPPPSTSSTTTVPPGPTSSTIPGATTTTQAPPPGVAPGRLAVIANDGALVTVRADGSDVSTVTEAPPSGTVVQLAWAPDGVRLAFSTTTSRNATVGVGSVDGLAPTTSEIVTAPYHLAWNALQTQLAMLRVDTVDTVELAMVDAGLTATPVSIRSGAPVTAAWSPDGARLLVVVEEQLVVALPDGRDKVLAERAAPAGAPAWLDDRTILAAVQTAGDRRLVRLDVDTGARQDLLIYDGIITFLPDTAGNRIAYQVVPDDGSDGTGGRVSFPRSGGRSGAVVGQVAGDPPAAQQGVLAAFDVQLGVSREVLDEPAQAFQWSPDGARLAFLDPVDAGSSRWRFWGADAAVGGTAVDGPQFAPSPTFVELLQPYFDQLAPSTDWWSPDGAAFTFAGRVQGRDGVWVIPTAAAAAPTFVHDGEVVAWSPR